MCITHWNIGGAGSFYKEKVSLLSKLDKSSLISAKKTDQNLNVLYFLQIQDICKNKGPNFLCG